MKSMSLLFLAAAGFALYVSSASVGTSGGYVLVASSVSSETWRRACAFMGPEGVRRIEVEAHESCESAPELDDAARVRQAGLAR